jgi:hypothetical protein
MNENSKRFPQRTLEALRAVSKQLILLAGLPGYVSNFLPHAKR